jgi:PAS domain S-box-containing protein
MSATKELHVLIVEDNEDDARLLLLQLRRNGYRPVSRTVQTAEEMERAFDEKPWDLVIADYFLPNFNALAALDVVHRRGLDLPFLIVSGTIGEETAVEAMRAGAHDYIMKGSSARLIPAIARELREAGERANRRRAEEALRDSERRFRALIEHSSDILTVVDAAGRILYESPSVERLLGHTAGELMGAALEEHVHPEDRHALATALAQSAGASAPVAAEFRMRDRGGEWRSLEASVSNLLDNAEVGGIVLNSRDITARKQDEEMIRHLAYFDALTGLPNRMLFDDRLSQALAHSAVAAHTGWPSSPSTSTASRPSTRRWGMAPATNCCGPRPHASASSSARRTRSRVSAGTSSCSCSRRSTRSKTPRGSRGRS